MGRTLHYEVTNPQDITDSDRAVMLRISNEYNRGKYQNVWTCEQFHLHPLDFYPNWSYFKNHSHMQAWETLHRKIDELEKAGTSPFDCIREMNKQGLILLHRSEEEVRGFCKVGGNEYNASLIYEALLKVSLKTKAEIHLDDEGRFLLAPVFIKKGQVRADRKVLEEQWAFWEKENFLASNEVGVADLKKEQEALLNEVPDWGAATKFCRKVKPRDFKQYPKYNPCQITAGFYGEYWNLNGDFDPETESLKIAANLKKLAEEQGAELHFGGIE